MAYINAYKLKGAGGGTQDYGFLVDQLEIRKNQLEADGNLSPGDYDLLTKMARQLYTNPGLTPAQRSNISVKISDYESQAKVKTIKDNGSVDRLNRDIKDTKMEAQSLTIGTPENFLRANAATEKIRVDKLQNEADRLDASFDDSSKVRDELDVARLDYLDALQALDDVQKKNPKSNYAAYAVTNSYGEVVSMEVKKVGTVSGYIPTNGTYGGLPLYGKINRVNESGKNVFSIGGQNFIEGKDIVTGPDGVSTVKKLTLEGSAKKGSNITVNVGTTEVGLPTLRSQNEVRRGGWAEGQNGTLYQRGEDGNYTKYVNQTKEQLGLKDGDAFRLSTTTEQSIAPYTMKTIDPVSDNVPPPMPPAPATSTAAIPTETTPALAPASKGRPNTGGAPTERAPSDAQGLASRVTGGVKSFFGSLFGR